MRIQEVAVVVDGYRQEIEIFFKKKKHLIETSGGTLVHRCNRGNLYFY
jgi:hypothetical protein